LAEKGVMTKSLTPFFNYTDGLSSNQLKN